MNKHELKYRAFVQKLKEYGLPPIEKEYRFHPTRKWRFDLAFVKDKVAIEIEGGVWTKGRHIRPSGYIKDMEKYNHAAMLGWRKLSFTPEQLFQSSTLHIIANTLNRSYDA